MRNPAPASFIGTTAVLVGFGLLATNTIKLPIVADMETVEGQPASNWERNQLMDDAKDKCKGIETMGGGLTATAVDFHPWRDCLCGEGGLIHSLVGC